MERGKAMFNTCKLSMGVISATSKSSFFDNIQQFILKRTTETEGWFLNYCDNTTNEPESKYLELILHKVGRKNEKMTKLTSLFEKNSVKSFKEEGRQSSDEDYSFTILKMGILMMSLLRKMPL